MQDPTRLFLLRHGQTAWNAEMRIQGQLDIPLNSTGLWQARQLAQALRGESLAAIHSSDLQRARQTAAPLAEHSKLAVQLDAGLRERCFGTWEGHTYAEIERRFPLETQRWRRRDPDFAPGDGEPLQAFHDRCVQAVESLLARHPGQTIAIVAHGGVLDCIYRAALRIALQAPRTWQLDNATVNRLLWTSEGLSLVGWNDTGHLHAVPGGAGADTA